MKILSILLIRWKVNNLNWCLQPRDQHDRLYNSSKSGNEKTSQTNSYLYKRMMNMCVKEITIVTVIHNRVVLMFICCITADITTNNSKRWVDADIYQNKKIGNVYFG